MTTANYGDLHDYNTGDYLRHATRRELLESLASGPEGAFDLDGRTVAVIGGPEPVVVCGRRVWHDISGVGHNWRLALTGDLLPTEELEEAIMEECEDTGRMIASESGEACIGGERYRWGV